jgi:NADPH-dependent glutamate synthase beta subunit-like oxidoreductase/Pyruvate/2-oxoacid:ferredoxin oxidoreductase delta subunit
MVKHYQPHLNRDDPFVAISLQSSRVFKTGDQRSEKPLFSNKIAPCRQACPIGIDIPTAFHLVSKGDIDGALQAFLRENPLPGVCGRVCYHPCEAECNRGNFDEPVGVRGLERFVSDHGNADITADGAAGSKKEEIAVIGSGPAGLSASYHLARLGYHVTLFEAMPELGGMLRYGIPPYRLPRSILEREIKRILSLGVHAQLENTAGKDISWKELRSFDAIFLSVGLQAGKSIPELNAHGAAVITGLDFLADPWRWSLEDDRKKVLIIGGGNVAIDAARTLMRIRRGGVSNITLVCPESRDQMPALPEEIEEAEEEGLSVVNGWAPHRLHKDGDRPISLHCKRAEVLIDKETGSLEITTVGREIQGYPVDTIIVAIGQYLRTHSLPPGIDIQDGTIVTDRFGFTSLPRVFAGGDATGGRAFVADAVADGKRGALAISCSLEGRDIEEALQLSGVGQGRAFSIEHYNRRGSEKDTGALKTVITYEHINTLFFSERPRRDPERLQPEARRKSFDEVASGLEPSVMADEATRCFRCGTCIDCEICLDFCPDLSIVKDAISGIYGFDPDYCKGCGICSVACPRGVIEMVGERP